MSRKSWWPWSWQGTAITGEKTVLGTWGSVVFLQHVFLCMVVSTLRCLMCDQHLKHQREPKDLGYECTGTYIMLFSKSTHMYLCWLFKIKIQNCMPRFYNLTFFTFIRNWWEYMKEIIFTKLLPYSMYFIILINIISHV